MPDNEIREWLLKTIQLMVDRPIDVAVEAVAGGRGTTYHIRTNPLDYGMVIGKQGRTARSLRTIAAAVGKKHGTECTLDIECGAALKL